MARTPKPDFTGKSLTDTPPYLFQPHKNEKHRDLRFPLYCMGKGKVDRLEAQWQERANREERDAAAQQRPVKNLDLELQISEKEQIGPIRAIYYRELVLENYYQGVLQYSRFANTSFFCSEGRKRDPKEWLTYDRYLTKILSSLGLNWWDVEQVIFKEFQRPIPKKFMASTPGLDNVISLWQIAWTDRMAAVEAQRGKRSAKKGKDIAEKVRLAGRLEAIANGELTCFAVGFNETISLNGTYQISGETGEDQTILEALHHYYPEMPLGHRSGNSLNGSLLYNLCLTKIQAEHFLKSEPESTDKYFIRYSTRQRSPFINRTIFVLGLNMWRNINTDSKPASKLVKYIQDRNKVWRDFGADPYDMAYFLPEEFYMLLADILYHLPVVLGLPDSHKITEAKSSDENDEGVPFPNWEGLTADNIRQRFGEEYKKQRRRK